MPTDLLAEMRENDFGEVLARELAVKKDPKVKHDDRALSVFLRIEDGQLGTTHPSTYSSDRSREQDQTSQLHR